MLVVSNIDLTKNVQTIKPSKFLESSIKGFTLNLNNDYRYLKTGYYVSVHAEVLGNPVIPSSVDAIDANRTPILLLKASKAGIPVLPYITTSSVREIMSTFKFPVVLFAVNPFSYAGFQVAKNRSALYRAVKSLEICYKFAVCAMPFVGEMVSFKSIFGKCDCSDEKLRGISGRAYEVFKIPVCRLHVQRSGKEAYLCGLEPVRMEEIFPRDLDLMSEEVSAMCKSVDFVG